MGGGVHEWTTHLSAWGHGEGAGRESLARGWVMGNIGHQVDVERAQDADAREF